MSLEGPSTSLAGTWVCPINKVIKRTVSQYHPRRITLLGKTYFSVSGYTPLASIQIHFTTTDVWSAESGEYVVGGDANPEE